MDFVLRNSKELQRTPKNSKELQRTPNGPDGLQQPARTVEQEWFMPFGLFEPNGTYSRQMNSPATPIGRDAPWPRMGESGIPTVSRQKCRDSRAAGLRGGESRQRSRHFGGMAQSSGWSISSSRQFSRQGVVSKRVPNQAIPTIIPTECRDSGAARRNNPAEYPAILAGYSAPLSGHFVRLQQHPSA